VIDRARTEAVIAKMRAAQQRDAVVAGFTDEWFDEQRAFADDPAQLKAALCGRRAGKTRMGNRDYVWCASTTQHGRFLYLNETRAEARRLAWFGARGDGMAALVEKHKLNAVCHESDLTIRFPDIDSWIYLIGADDERAVTKALGVPYHKIWWDEFQKVRTSLTQTIREVMLPTLLDYRGQFQVTGTPKRNANGMFHDITQPTVSKRMPGWSVHHWNLLANPFFGRAEQRDGKWFVLARLKDTISGPHAPGELEAAIRGARWTTGILALQQLLGGPEVAPIGSPLLRREGLGEWAYEDSSYVYPVHAIDQDLLCFAPARLREDGFPDILRALEDLPEWGEREYFLVLGADLGYSPGAFAFGLWAWSLQDDVLYEVASWKKTELDSDQQVEILKSVRDIVPISITVADAGGGGAEVVPGWSKKWITRYGVPILEATKKNKHGAINLMSNDIKNRKLRCRSGGAWLEEAREHQWLSILSATGKLIEDPTTPNHVLDCSLYAHRESYHHRFREAAPQILPNTAAWVLQEERDLEQAALDPAGDERRGPYSSRW
jgi:hypothetical protein